MEKPLHFEYVALRNVYMKELAIKLWVMVYIELFCIPLMCVTWKSPGDIVRNQIDYILVSQRYRNSLKQVKTYPGADVDSDHNPVIAKLEIKLENIRQFKRKEQV